MDWVLGKGKVIDQSHCGASIYYIKVTDLILGYDVLLEESLGVRLLLLEVVHEEAKLL